MTYSMSILYFTLTKISFFFLQIGSHQFYFQFKIEFHVVDSFICVPTVTMTEVDLSFHNSDEFLVFLMEQLSLKMQTYIVANV